MSTAPDAAVRYVDPAHPAAQDAGAGAATQPYRTLTYAMNQLQPGDTLHIAGGIYRETLRFSAIDWSRAPTVVQARGAEQVSIRGSDVVTGWQRVQSGRFVKQPWTVNTQQVFVDGVSLRQIGGKIFTDDASLWPGRKPGGLAQMTNNSFYYDAAAQALYIQLPFDALDGHVVEASVRPYVAFGQNLAGITLRNLRFRHANTTAVNHAGAVNLQGNRLVLDRLEVTWVDGAGFDIQGDDNLIQASRGNHCGQLGMKVRGYRNRLLNNESSYNNHRGFSKWWEAGGVKFVGDGGLRDSEVSGHRAIGNNGDGIWFDWMNSDNRVHDNISAYNTGFGIQYEASQNARIYDNYAFANGQRGIYLPHSAGSVVAYNMAVMNGLEGIVVIDEGRNADDPLLRPRANRVVDNIVGWNGRQVLVLPTGLLGNSADFNLYVGAAVPSFSLGWPSATNPIVQGLDLWRTNSGQDTHSWYEATDAPQSLRTAVAAKQTNVDWAPVRALAPMFHTPPVPELGSDGNRSRPGPQP